MLRVLSNRPIGKKLTLIGLLTNGLALLLAFVGFMGHEVFVFRQSSIDDHESTARILAIRCAPLLGSSDVDAGARQLNAVAVHPHIDAVTLYDASGRVFAEYQRAAGGNVPAVAAMPKPGNRWSMDAFQTIEPVTLRGERVGTLLLTSNLTELRARMATSALFATAVLVSAGFVAFCVTRRLQRFITAPVSHLGDVASAVAKNGDYTVRARKHSNDELGRLVDSFNAMLTQIELGDLALREAHDRLEARVEERTRELQQEVAERRRSEQALNESHERLHIVTRATSDAVWDWNISADSRCWNENYQTLFGYRLDEVPVTVEAWQARIHPDDEPAVSAGLVAALDAENSLWSCEYRYRRDDGSYACVFDRGYIIRNEEGRPTRMIGAMQDISERKLAQEEAAREQARFKFIFEAVPVGISLVLPGEDGTHLVNPAHERITGIPRERSTETGIFARATHPDDLRRQEEFSRKYNAGEIEHFSIEKRYLHGAGKTIWAAMTSRLFTDPVTGRKLSVTTLVDITERKHAEAKLAETHKQLLDTSRQAGMAEVATGVLHNVGNVLNSVNVSATLLGDLVRQSKSDRVARLRELIAQHEADLATFFTQDPRGRQVPGYLQTLAAHLAKERDELLAELETLRKNVEHIKDIVAMQQSYARVSGVSETVTVAELIEDAVRMNVGTFEHHHVELVRDYDSLPVVTVQKHKVLQILVNLLRNAKHACDDSGKEEKQVIVRAVAERGRVKISVIDNGVGIPIENLTRIFAHGFTTRKNGHGFGLHSGALAARELGGSLTAHSDGAGLGATFVLDLPESLEVKAA
jgi:PAS domain S-box-containing protein